MIGVGDKVVCVERFTGEVMPGYAPNITPNAKPQVGQVYVVDGFFFPDHGKYFGLILVGLPSLSSRDGEEVGFAHFKFRKLSDHRNEAELSYRRSQQQPNLQPQHE